MMLIFSIDDEGGDGDRGGSGNDDDDDPEELSIPKAQPKSNVST